MSDALSKNNDCDLNKLDSEKEDVGDSVTGGLPKKNPADEEKRPGLVAKNKKNYPAKHGLWVDFRKVQVDGRTRLGKWMKSLRENLKKDLGGNLTTMEEVLLDRIVSKVVQNHLYEVGILSGKEFGSRDFYIALSNSLRRDLAVIGLKKKPEKLLDLGECLKQKGTKEP